MKSGISNGASALAVALVLSTSVAMAQDAAAPQENVGLQDIVVTAQKRSESAQQVPIAISAVTSEARSEEHTSELQSLMRISYAVFCLKKKKQQTHIQSMKYVTIDTQ